MTISDGFKKLTLAAIGVSHLKYSDYRADGIGYYFFFVYIKSTNQYYCEAAYVLFL